MLEETKEAARQFGEHSETCPTCSDTTRRMCDVGARLMAIFNRCVDAEMAGDAKARELLLRKARGR